MTNSAKQSNRITIEDVARIANVSHATVSRVVSGKGYVSDDTRQRVIDAVVRTGYVVNRQARGLAKGRTQVVGLVVPDLDTSYMGEIVRGIDETLAAANYDLLLFTTHHRRQRESAFVSTLTGGLSDGLLLILPSDPGSYLDLIRRRGFPYVIIDHGGANEQGPSVGATNFSGAYEATSYLIGLGHHRIGFVTGHMDRGCAADRLNGYKAALARHDVPFCSDLVAIGDFHQPLGYAGGRRLLALEDPPTAIFASNDSSAFGVMEAIRDCGLLIGTHVSVVGFDDIPAASGVNPALTTVRQPLEEMGREATRMLLDLIDARPLKADRIDLPTELVIRDSCCPRAGPEEGAG